MYCSIKRMFIKSKDINECSTTMNINHDDLNVEQEEEQEEEEEKDFLCKVVDVVIKKYDVLDFETSPIGAIRNIYIDKQFTKLWTAIQMNDKCSKKYINKKNSKFII